MWGDASSSSGNTSNNADGGYGGDDYGTGDDDYYNQVDGSRGRIYRPESEIYGGRRGSVDYNDDSEVREYFEQSGQVEQLALTHRYPSIPFELEPSTYYIGSTIHCITR